MLSCKKQVNDCTRKRPFRTKKQAKKQAKITAKYKGNGNHKLIPYECEWCGLWHLGHKKRPRE